MYSISRFDRLGVSGNLAGPAILVLTISTVFFIIVSMPIAICGVSEVPNFAAVPLDHIISIRDSSQPAPDIRAFKTNFTLHSFVFDDTSDKSSPKAINEKTTQRLLDIYQQINMEQNVLFHCFAGVSRSSAAAFIWLVYHGATYAEAYQIIVTARGPFVCPNQLMVGYADRLMGQNGRMIDFLVKELGKREPERAAYFSSL